MKPGAAPPVRRGRERGLALIVVLWMVAVGALMVSAFNSALRASLRVEGAELEAARRKAAIWAAVDIAASRISEPNDLQKWKSSLIPRQVTFGDSNLSIRVTAHSGRIDLNLADEQLIRGLAVQVASDPRQADSIADRILDWRDSDRDRRANGAEDSEYRAAGLQYGPADGEFQTPQHVLRLLNMDYATATKLRPLVTVYGNASTINPMFAPQGVLASLPGISSETVTQIMTLREVATSEVLKSYLQPYQQFLDENDGPVYSIEITVERKGVTSAPVEVTIIASRTTKSPYRVLGFEALPAPVPAVANAR